MVSIEIKEWISKADKDLDEAKFLFENSRPLEEVAYFVHQSIEKYLKGFLIFHGWELEKTHDLVRLIRETCRIDRSFEQFIPAMEKITDFYIESRYPIGYEVEYTYEELKEAIETADSIQKSIKTRIGLEG